MLLGGLWHGAALTFVVWGGIHGVALAVERLLGLNGLSRRAGPRGIRIAWYIVVQAVVMLAWVFFRSDTAAGALTFVVNIGRLDFGAPRPAIQAAMLFALPVVVMHVHRFLVEQGLAPSLPRRGLAALTGAMLYAVLVFYGATTEFIYSQFCRDGRGGAGEESAFAG
jgi:alginate O-acetyltransferase complex protein AlgI